MPVITCIDDLKHLHKRRTPKMFYDYAESGSYTEQTFRDNTSDFAKLLLRQKVAVDMSGRTTESTMIGEKVAMPVALAPVGLTGMQAADGEIKAARAAEKFGVPYTLSTMSICSIEDVAAHTTKPFWFQVYTLKDDDFMRRLFERARAANCSAIVITVDLQILGQRHKDLKNGLSAPPKFTVKSMANLATKIAWGLEMLGTKRRFFGNIVGHAKGVSDPSSLSSWTAEAFDLTLDWKRIAKFKEMGRCDCGVKPRRAATGWRAVVDPGAAGHRRCCGRQDRGAYGQWHPLGSGRAKGAGDGGQGHHDRAILYLRSGGHGRGRGHQIARGHPEGTQHLNGIVWRA